MLTQAPPVTEGTMRTPEGEVLPLEGTDVRARVVGPVAEVEVRQRFRNPLDRAIEAVYLFPLPHEASVHRMEFRLRDRVVKAVVKEKEEARRSYEAARSQGRAATLLEQERPNLFTLSVANLPPGEVVEVLLGYHERLAYDDGEWRLVFPLVASERYHAGTPTRTGGTEEVPDAARIRPPRAKKDERAPDVTLEVQLEAGRAVEAPHSPTHRLDVSGSGATWKVRLHDSDRLPNRDFVLAWRAGRAGVRPEAWFHREEGKPGTFLLLLTPPEPGPKAGKAPSGTGCTNCGAPMEDPDSVREVPGLGPAWRCVYCGAMVATNLPAARKPLPRDVAILVDRSASMRAATAAGTLAAVDALLGALAPEDAVQILAFDHGVQAAGADWLPVGEAARARTRAFLEGLRPRGGTELEAALQAAADLPVREKRTRVVVLLTDAAVGNEGRLLRRVPAILGPETRLYVLGLGAAPNRYLVAQLARAGGGACDVLVPGEPPEAVLPRFARRVAEAGPVLRGLGLAWEEAVPLDVYPSPPPDLFSGQPVQLVGRFTGSGPARLVLTATTASGAPFRQEIDLVLPDRVEGPPGLERLWARLRIDSRMERLAGHPEEASDVRLEVLGLALKHGLVSAWTSLVAEDLEVTAEPGGQPERFEVPSLPVADAEVSAAPAGAPAPAAPAAERSRTSRREEARMDFAASAVEFLEDDLGGPPTGGLAGAPPPGPMAPPPPPMRSAMAAPLHRLAHPGKGGGGPMAGMDFLPKAASSVVEGLKRVFSPEHGEKTEFARPGPPSRGAAPARGQEPLRAPGSESYPEAELAWARQRVAGEIDLVFLVDETGSMGPYIEEVKRRLLELVEALKASALCRSLRLGLVTYRDHPPQDSSFVSRAVPLTEDIRAVRKGVEQMQASGGGDGPEAVTDGLHDLLNLDWRPGAVRVVVWVGDAPPHGVEPHGDGFPEGCPCGHHWFVQAESCREMGISVHAVGCLPGLRGFVGAEDVFRTVARTTRGLFVPLAQASLLTPLIAGVADRELDRKRLEEHIAEILREQQPLLQPAEDQERVRYVREVLASRGVRRLDLGPDAGAAATPLRFRELRDQDIQEGLDELRRLERTAL